MLEITNLFVSLLAAAGGGGSDSGGGDGALIAVVGYLPAHAIGAAFRKKFNKSPELKTPLQILGWILASTIALIWIIIGIAIISSSDGIGFWLVIAGVFAWPGMGAGLYGWFGKIKQSKAAKQAIQQAAQQDSAWNEDHLKSGAEKIFTMFQNDWSTFSTESMKNYLTPRYHRHVSLMMRALQEMNRQNIMKIDSFTQTHIIAVNDATDNANDSFVTGFDVSAEDTLIDMTNHQHLFTNMNNIEEFWHFVRDGNGWRLDGIQPATAVSWVANPPMEQFAINNTAFYSLDWGWLLLPQRGQLFAGGKFGTSDINNHIIGQLTRTKHIQQDDAVYQLYTYSEQPAANGTRQYLVAQVAVPKTYGNIIVRRKKGLFQFKIRGLKKVSTEWSDFNKKFQVFATSSEQATSFELLNPKFMEQLEAAPFEINLEVADNVVYFYAPLKKIDATHYESILKILQVGYREMRL